MNLITDLLQNIESLLKMGGDTLLFFISVLEAVPFVGIIIPGQSIIIVSGFLARLGFFDLYFILFIVSFGSIVGDCIGYYLGKRYGMSFVEKYGKYFFIKDDIIEKTKELVNKHAGKALVIGRFSPTMTRSFIPFVAGTANVPQSKFYLYNILGGVLWSVSSIMLGYIFGAGYEAASQYYGQAIVFAVLIIVYIIAAYAYINKKNNIFGKRHIYALLGLISSIYILFKTFQDIFSEVSNFAYVDVWVNNNRVLLESEFLTNTLVLLTTLFNSKIAVIWLLLIFLFILIKKRVRDFVFGSTIAILTTSLGYYLKGFVGRFRPGGSIIEAEGFAFPSGHALLSSLVCGLFLYFFLLRTKNKIYRGLMIFFCVAIPIAVAFSRVYLGVHWLSDVLAGLALGAGGVSLLILFEQIAIKYENKIKIRNK